MTLINYVCYGKLDFHLNLHFLKKKNPQNKYDDNINQSLIPSVFDKIHLVTRDKVQIDKTVNPSDLRNTST